MTFDPVSANSNIYNVQNVFSSVSAKIVILVSATAFLTALFIGGFFYQRTTETLLNNNISSLENETHLIVPLFQAAFDDMRHDVRVLASTPPIQGLARTAHNSGIDPLDGSSSALWKQRLETIFSSMISEKSNYVQLRYIGVADNGRELIRVNRSGAIIKTVQQENLQPKGDKSYFKQAIKLPPSSVYYSAIELNREHGKVQKPFLPVVRALVPVYDENNKVFGAIAINASFKNILNNILRDLNIKADLYVMNETGDYLVQRKNSVQPELYFEQTSHDNPLIQAVLDKNIKEDVMFSDIDGKTYVTHFRKLYFDPLEPERFIGIALSQPEADLLKASHETRQNALLLAIILILSAFICAAVLSYFLSRPLKQMIYELRSFALGKRNLELPVHLRDEIGELARTFENLITDLDQARASEKQTLAKMEAIMDNTVDGLITINDRGIVEGYNKACERIFGYRSDDVLGRNVKMLMPEPYHGEHDSYLKNYRDTGQKKIIGIGREVEGKREDGGLFPIDLSISEINIQGRTLYSGIVRDISDRKEAENEILRSNTELERFAYIASHDLQEPLRMVANFTGLLEEEYKEDMDEQASEYMTFIIDAARRMQELVGDLLEYSRVGQQEGNFVDVDCKLHTEMVLTNLQDAIEETKAKITIGELPFIRANPMHFSRLMQNLIGNGIKYRRKDAPPEITIKAQTKGKEWLFSVSDNGIGMKEEYLEQIFIIFKRLHGKKEYKGTGIGLAICKKIVESFDGEIWVESKPGIGSTFYFTVPKEESARKAA